jgi:hypothetical protein
METLKNLKLNLGFHNLLLLKLINIRGVQCVYKVEKMMYDVISFCVILVIS